MHEVVINVAQNHRFFDERGMLRDTLPVGRSERNMWNKCASGGRNGTVVFTQQGDATPTKTRTDTIVGYVMESLVN